jgi:CysZ protein
MNAINDHFFALKLSVLQLTKGKIWLYIIPSLAVALFFYSIFSFFHSISEGAKVAEDVPFVGAYLSGGVRTFIDVLVFVTDEFYKFFILTLLSPVNCLLSEKVDNDLTGAHFQGGITRILKDVLRAIFLLFFTLMLNLLAMTLWWLFTWITGFHAIDFCMYFLIGAFFIGFSFYDFSLERYNVGFFGTVEFGFERILYLICTGALFSLIYLIPWFGIILAPFIVTILSTIVYLKMNRKIPAQSRINHNES